jgi:hypothetical protein
VHAFDERVDGQDLDAVSLRLDHRRIVANAHEQPVRRRRQLLLDARDEVRLGEIPDGGTRGWRFEVRVSGFSNL